MAHDVPPTPLPEATTPIERLIRPFQVFAQHKGAGALLLLAVTMLAILMANSPWAAAYRGILNMKVTVGAGEFQISKALLLWINDGLMGIFFFVVGLELKREVLAGRLSSPRQAALPIAGAIGGMAVPAGIFLAINWGGAGQHGWGIPMATDIAFALGVLSLMGNRVPTSLKVFLTALAIVDDIGGILVIAVFYTDHIAVVSLILGGVLCGLSIAANLVGVRNQVLFLVLGTLAWVAFLKSGVHATLAAVIMAMTIPARTKTPGSEFLDKMTALLAELRNMGMHVGKRLKTPLQQNTFEEMATLIDDSTAPLQRLEHALMPVVTFLVLPIFAFANGGLVFDAGLTGALVHPVSLGIIFGLLIGKQVGITLFAWLAVRLGWATLPEGIGWRHVHAVSVLAGIGFTMALFIGGLAFKDPELQRAARVGILAASVLSGVAGCVMLYRLPRGGTAMDDPPCT